MEKLIFLDRDGVINKDVEDGYISSLDLLKVFPSALQAIKKLTKLGYKIIVISNQAGIAKGLYTMRTLSIITQEIRKKVKKSGGKINSFYYCHHRKEDNCLCRKPKTALFKAALDGKRIDLSRVFVVGDSERDIEAGKRLGAKTILVLTGKTKKKAEIDNFKTRPDFTAKNLKEAVNNIITRKNYLNKLEVKKNRSDE